MKKGKIMMLSLLLIPLILFSACGTPLAPPSVEIEPPAQVQPVQPDEPAEAVPDPAELLYQGQASMRVVTDEGKVIYIDPYVGEGYDLPADLILVTHAHYDHNGVDRIESRNPDCQVITWKEAIQDGEHQVFDLGYVTVEAVEAGYNRWHDVSECVGYVLTFSNGRSIYVTGDTSTMEQMPDMAEMEIDFDSGAAAIDASLRRLNLDYIDLMILHHSQPSNDVDAYKSMEQAVNQGKLRSIGLSNYYTPEDFDRLVNATTITPALLQNETHPHYQGTAMKEHLKQYGTVLESWFPLGGRGHTQELFNDPTISSIAAAHSKTSAQVLLRWHLQAGNIAIPGSSNEAHIAENFDIFDFELTDAEMQRIAAMDQNRRHASY